MKIDLDDERYEGMLVADGLDEAIIGTATLPQGAEVFVYDVESVILILVQRDGMSLEDAHEFFSFNIQGAYVGEQTPIWMYPIDD